MDYITIIQLKDIIKGLPDDMKILISSDGEWNKIRECEFYDVDGFVWSSKNQELHSTEDLEEDEYEDLEVCLILS